jgi:hypothetical protein
VGLWDNKENSMAVTKMRRPGEEEISEQQPQSKRYMVRPSFGSQYETVPTNMQQMAPNQFSVTPSTEPQVHIHMAPSTMKRLPMYDDGGDVTAPDPLQDLPGSNNAEVQPIAQSVAGDAATPSLTFGGKVNNALQKFSKGAGEGGMDPNSMPGQGAATHQYAVQGLSGTAPIMDDGGLVKKISGAGSRVVAPDDDSASGIAAKNQNIQEYKSATEAPKEENRQYVPSPADRINPSAKYGNRPGEERIDVSSYIKPIGMYDDGGPVRMTRMYDDGGPVKNDPNDGHHQLAVLEEGERVLTPEENKAYEERKQGVMNGAVQLEQPNPPVRPMMDTERDVQQPVGGAKMDTSNPPAAEVEPASMRTTSNEVTPAMSAPATTPAPTAGGVPKMQRNPSTPDIMGQTIQDQAQPEHNPMATSSSAAPLPSEREKLESERSALKQKMADAAEGTNNNGKFDHIAYGEAKMALADLNKAHPWGQPGNHESFLGKLGHGLATAGEVASDVVLGPGITSRIPGTRENLNQQAAQGQQQVTQGLAGKASEAETALKQAQTQLAGRPKDPKQGIAFETFNMQHSAPGSPEYERARENLAVYQEQDKQMNANKAASKPELLPQDVAAQTRKVLSLPKGSPERAQAEQDLSFMEKQQQQSGKLTDRHREINDYAVQHNLDPEDPDQYAQATMGYEKDKTSAKAVGGFPTWQKKANIQNSLATERELLVQKNADANQFGVKAAELQQKADADYIKADGHIKVIQKALDNSDASQVSANIVPLMATLNVIHDVGGISRLNKQELDAFVPGHGSATRWLEANWDKIAVGELPDDYQKELGGLIKDLQANVDENHTAYTKAIDKNFRQHAQDTSVTPNTKGGTNVTSKPTAPQGEKADEKGKTRVPVYVDGKVIGYK